MSETVTEFDGYYNKEPEKYKYVADDFPGPKFAKRGSVALFVADRDILDKFPDEPLYAYVRLSPDTQFKSWGAQYVAVRECIRGDQHEIELNLHVTVGEPWKGGFGLVANTAWIDVKIIGLDWEHPIVSRNTPPECQAELDRKLCKLREWYESEWMRRDAGKRRPLAWRLYQKGRRRKQIWAVGYA